ncbi:MAG: M23 family metallopeptidase [Candidatus Peribacteraceae bacterium]|nr:M23 family metallopeptidase [Candidatus Peribacteraceae bacterium]MDD5074757.1 M23 family metallopeptidase [Candidatus Peribacteraceae bacterium]
MLRRNVLIGLSLLLSACTNAAAPQGDTVPSNSPENSTSSSGNIGVLAFPLPQSENRITKKPFGIFITPATSPVRPERFTGYHTGTDFEIFPDEQNTDVQVAAVCEGKVRFTGWVKGYGGVLIQDCTYQGKTVTVLYGHLKISSVSQSAGDVLSAGTAIGLLGEGSGTETDGERKHLHLSVHRGSAIEYRGYVSSSPELDQWINAYP